jgi:hypothetical protein
VALAHLQDLANAGTGTPSGNNAPYYVANDPAQMVSAFDTIIKGVRNCRFSLNGTVAAGKEDTGLVTLDGQPLAYGDPDGWRLMDGKTLELQGTACSTFKEADKPTLDASFGCGGIIN